MNPIVTKEGEYLSLYFIAKNNTKWELIGTASAGKKAIDSLDTFINRASGKYFERNRSEVFDAAEKKTISSVPFKITTQPKTEQASITLK